MTVKELIKKLQEYDPDRIVVLSSDSEGNHYDTAYSIGTGSFNEEDNQFGLEELTEEDKKAGYCEEDVIEGVPALCIWP